MTNRIITSFHVLDHKEQKFLIVSIVLLAVGFALLGLVGLPILWDIHQSEVNPQCYIELDCKSDGFDYDMRDNKGNLETMIHVYYDFQTPVVFSASNQINYNINVDVDKSQYVKKTLLLIDVDDKMGVKNLNNLTYDIVKPLINNSTIIPPYSQVPVLDLSSTSSNKFTGKNQLYFWGITGNVKLALLVVDEKNMTHVSGEFGPVFQVQSYETKIQADQNEQEKKSNKQILALTWMGVALVPILIGADYIGRIFLD